jgi:lipopolysaccharide export system ATP-binding protein
MHPIHSLKTVDVKKSYPNKIAVNEINITIESGKCVGLLGPNGAGKTSLFYLIVGLIYPEKGHIFLDEKDITRIPIHERAKLGLSYLPQETSVFRKLTVRQNIEAILELRHDLSKTERIEKCQTLLDEFNLTPIAKSLGMSLSGGEKRRVEIARALALSPLFILLDEPFAGVDPISVIDIKNTIKALCNKNIGILITDHHVRETLQICDTAYIMAEGKLLCEGTPDIILNDEAVKKIYLGQSFTI